MNSDRNLLFGILALQMDFITRDQLVDAMSLWVTNKSKPLEDILEEQQALSDEARGVLTPLVEMHIKHHGDATQSLAVLSGVGSIKDALETIGDDDVGASIGHFPGLSVTDVDTTAPYKGTSDSLRYQILRPHAKGGLGEVSVALDTELNREVALKEIQDQYADHEQSRSRFVVEAEITGGLEHPGIVPVYGLGHYEDGRPYYAMRFIKGDSLKQAADEFHKNKSSDPSERSLQLRKLLGRFIDVCNAIEYAHSRGVLHRDLKPGNIMLGKYGETLVVDWGLAKPVGRSDKDTYPDEQTLKPSSGSSSAPTQMGKAIGTPAYMSPEQADGRLDDLGATSDVYSLGATLYYVLTGKGPVGGDTNVEVLEKVRRGELVPPREIDADIPKPLSAICMRSMAKNQKQRYESPQALADDVERFLADEPVASFTEPMTIRTRRWMRKHPRTVASMAATLLVGLTSTLIIATVVSGKNLELANKNTELDGKNVELATANSELNETNEALVEANNKEKAAKEEAEQQQRIAQAVRDFLQKDLLQQADVTEQADRLLAIGGSQFQTEQNPTIRELLDRAAAELTPATIDDKFPNQPLVQAEILWTVGVTFRKIGSSGGEAVDHLERAQKLYESELGLDHLQTVNCANSLAVAYGLIGDFQTALRLHKEVLKKSKAILGTDAPLTLTSMSNLAGAYHSAGDFQEARLLLEEVSEKRKAILGTDAPLTLTSRSNLASVYESLGNFQLALLLHKEVLEKRKAIQGADHPRTLISMSNLAGAYESAGDFQTALLLHKEVLEKRKAILGSDDPDTMISMNNLAIAYGSAGDSQTALLLHKEAVEKHKAIQGADHPDTLTGMNNLAVAYRSAGDFQTALLLHKEVFEKRKTVLGADHPSTLNSMHCLALAYDSADDFQTALPLHKEVVEKSKAILGADHPDTLSSMNNLASAYESAGDFQTALLLHKEVLEKRKAILGADHPDTLTSMSNLAGAYHSAGDFQEARLLLKDVSEKRKATLGADHPRTLNSMIGLAVVYRSLGDFQTALLLHKEVFEKRKATQGADHPRTLISMSNLAGAYESAGDFQTALLLHKEVFEKRKTVLGADHPSTLNSMIILAAAYGLAGEFQMALPLQEEVLENQEATLGADHSDTLLTMSNLAVTYWRIDKLDKSIPMFEEILRLKVTELGPDHPNTIETKANLGVNYKGAGRVIEALPLLEEAYGASKQQPSLRWVEKALLDGYVKAMKVGKAVRLTQELLTLDRNNIPNESRELAQKLMSYADALLQVKALNEAEPMLRESLAIREKNIPDSWLVFNTKSVLGAALLGQAKASLETDGNTAPAKLTEAEQLLLNGYNGMKKREATISERVRNTRLTEALERLADLYTTWDKPDEAAKWQAELDKRKAESKKDEADDEPASDPKAESSGESK